MLRYKWTAARLGLSEQCYFIAEVVDGPQGSLESCFETADLCVNGLIARQRSSAGWISFCMSTCRLLLFPESSGQVS